MRGLIAADQLTFDGLRSARAPRDRLFLGFHPPTEVVPQIRDLTRRLRHDHGLGGRPVAANHLYVTLYALDPRNGAPDALVEGLRRVASRLEAASFEVSFNAVASFLHKPINPPVMLLGEPEDLSELTTFRRRLVKGLTAAGLAERRFTHWFTPHVTLLYDRRIVPPTRIEPVRWAVRNFVLIRSYVGLTRHEVLGGWTLDE